MLSNASFWILSKYYNLEQELNKNLDSYELAHSISAIYNFLYDDMADWYIEYLKNSDTNELDFGKELFRQFVILTSPYCPFETEALWSQFFNQKELLATITRDRDWSSKALSVYFDVQKHIDLANDSRFLEFQSVTEFIRSIRSLKGLFAIDPVTSVEVFTDSQVLFEYADFVKLLSKASILPKTETILYEVKTATFSYSIDILEYLKDKDSEIARSNKIIDNLNKQIIGLESQLSNTKFVENAEPDIVLEKQSDLSNRKIEVIQQQTKIEFLCQKK